MYVDVVGQFCGLDKFLFICLRGAAEHTRWSFTNLNGRLKGDLL